MHIIELTKGANMREVQLELDLECKEVQLELDLEWNEYYKATRVG